MNRVAHRVEDPAGCLELLSDDLRLRLSPASRRVETLERQEDENPRSTANPVARNAEDPGCAVSALEGASCRRSSANEQHGRDRDRRDRSDDKTRPEEAHASSPVSHAEAMDCILKVWGTGRSRKWNGVPPEIGAGSNVEAVAERFQHDARVPGTRNGLAHRERAERPAGKPNLA